MTNPETSQHSESQAAFRAELPAVETLPSPERPKLKLTKVIAIAGPSYSGKNSVVDILAKRHGWKVYDGTEDGFRRRGNDSGAPIDRDPQEHSSFDQKQALMFANLKTDDEMWVHQTRLGPIILAAEIDERNEELLNQTWETQEGSLPAHTIEQIPAVSILLFTSDAERIQRAINHEKYLAGNENRRPRSKRTIIAEIRAKEKAETKSWQKQYGTVRIENNPFSRSLQRNYGNPVYNRFVNTDGKTPEEVADMIEEMALQLGAAEIIEEQATAENYEDVSGVGMTAAGDLSPDKFIDISDIERSDGEPISFNTDQRSRNQVSM